MNTDLVTSKLTMTLKEITDLLGVRHDNAMRIVDKMVEDQSFGHAPKIEERYNSGKNTLETYQLTKRQSVAIAAKLNTALLMRVIDRWQELEATSAKIELPTTYLEALKALVVAEEEKQKLVALTNQQNEQIEELQIELDSSKEWFSIKKVAQYNNISWKTIPWLPLKRHGLASGNTPHKVFDANFPAGVNVYHVDSWVAVYPSLNLPGREQ